MQQYTSDRRKNRSANAYVALGYQLMSSAQRAKFDVLVLADQQGLVVAQTGDTALGEEVAALSPILSANSKSWYGFIDTQKGKARLTVEPLQIQGRQLYLTASEGASAALISQEMQMSQNGIHRILH